MCKECFIHVTGGAFLRLMDIQCPCAPITLITAKSILFTKQYGSLILFQK